VPVETVIPWEHPDWDRYVAGHTGATVFHTSAWCRIVAEIGRYRPHCLAAIEGGRTAGVMPMMEIRSLLTGNRLGALPFSDECFPLADTPETARELIATALRVREERRLGQFEMRGAPAVTGEEGRNEGLTREAGLSSNSHYNGYRIPLSNDTEAVRMTFGRKSVRQMISKSAKLGVTVRRGSTEDDVREFYRLYVLNRKQHGIPPQPIQLFLTMTERLRGEPEAVVHLAEFEGTNVASLVSLRYNGVTYAKYEGIDLDYRHVLPVHALFWECIREAAEAGDRWFDLGRTAVDNAGLNEFKTRWGTELSSLPYFYYPPGEGLSVVKSDSWKYRLFTGVFQRLPVSATTRIGARIFRHFG
jgi:serine/alanine adding enzyme